MRVVRVGTPPAVVRVRTRDDVVVDHVQEEGCGQAHREPFGVLVLRRRPVAGFLFPYLQRVRSGDRANEFRQRCEGLEIQGVTLHSYRYAWAERARKAGYPERFAQATLEHNSKAVHRAYAKAANVGCLRSKIMKTKS